MPTRGLAVALAGLLSASPVFAQDAEKQVEAGSTSALFAVIGLAMDDELNIRATATATGVVIARVPNGTALKNRGCMTVNKYVWCKVEYPEDATVTGWSPARYLVEIAGSGTAEDLPAVAAVEADASSGNTAASPATETAAMEPDDGIMGSTVFAPPGERSVADDKKAPAVAAVQAIAEGIETDGDPVAAPAGTVQLPVTLGEELAKIEPNAGATAIAPPPAAPPFVIEKAEAVPEKPATAADGQDVVPVSNDGAKPPVAVGSTTVGAVVDDDVKAAGTPAPEVAKIAEPPAPAAGTADAAKAPVPGADKQTPEPTGSSGIAAIAARSGVPVSPSPRGAGKEAEKTPEADPAPVASAETVPEPAVETAADPAPAKVASSKDGPGKAEELALPGGGDAAPPEEDAAAKDEIAHAEEDADLASGKSGLELLRARFQKLEQIDEPASGGETAAIPEEPNQASGPADGKEPETVGGGPVSASQATPGKSDTDVAVAAAEVRDYDGVKTASGGFDATGEISCSRYFGQPMVRCHAGVLRGEKGEALVTVTWPDGGARVIRFRGGQVEGADAGDAVTAVREAELNLIRVGKGERFEIPDSFVFGG